MSETLTVSISDMKITNSPNVLITYSLGSCIGICIYDALKKIGAMGHILLPTKLSHIDDNNSYKYADTCIAEMVKQLINSGCALNRMTAKIAGGAEMFKIEGGNTAIGKIGQRNIKSVKDTLSELKINIVAEDTGLDYGRTMVFDTQNGQVLIKSFNHETKIF